MHDIIEKNSRILDAAADVEDLLRLAHEAIHRIHQDVHNDDFERVTRLSKKVHQLRIDARSLNSVLQNHVNTTGS